MSNVTPQWELQTLNRELDKLGVPKGDSEDLYSAWGRVQLAVQRAATGADSAAAAEVARLNAIINTPHADDFIQAVSIEAEHQRQRWGAEGDAGKTPADWFWLVGYLAGKGLHAHAAGNAEKAEHHIITTAAACANWHRAVFGKTNMRPGHEEGIAAGIPQQATSEKS